MTGVLHTEPRIAAPDDIYDLLIGLHAGLDERRSRIVSAKLILLLVNHIGDAAVVEAAIEAARLDTRAHSSSDPVGSS